MGESAIHLHDNFWGYVAVIEGIIENRVFASIIKNDICGPISVHPMSKHIIRPIITLKPLINLLNAIRYLGCG